MGEAYYKPLESKGQNIHRNVSMTMKRRVNINSVTRWVVLHVSLLSVFLFFKSNVLRAAKNNSES